MISNARDDPLDVMKNSFITHIDLSIVMKLATDYEKIVYKKLAMKVIGNLGDRQMNGYYFDDVNEGIEKVVELIPEGSTVGLGGTTTIIQSGLLDRLRRMPITLHDRYRDGLDREEITRMRMDSLTADVFIASTNAITVGGQLINIDGMGNRVAAMLYGPSRVILFAGVNKIVHSIGEGFRRIHSETAPINVQRFGADTPCKESGTCDREHCRAPRSICNKYVVMEGESDKDRIHVIIVGECFGF